VWTPAARPSAHRATDNARRHGHPPAHAPRGRRSGDVHGDGGREETHVALRTIGAHTESGRTEEAVRRRTSDDDGDVSGIGNGTPDVQTPSACRVSGRLIDPLRRG